MNGRLITGIPPPAGITRSVPATAQTRTATMRETPVAGRRGTTTNQLSDLPQRPHDTPIETTDGIRAAGYDPDMGELKTSVTVEIDPRLAAYAEKLVATGEAESVSDVVNDALDARKRRDQRARELWQEAAERADRGKVARMKAHVDAQLANLPASHRYR